MISENLKRRIYSSLILFSIFFLSFKYKIILNVSLMIVFIISTMELYNLLIKIFYKISSVSRFIKFFFLVFGSLYILLFIMTVSVSMNSQITKEILFYLFIICILSDLGGMVIGKIFKGKKLTKISPNKTVSGSIGSFLFSFFLIPLIYYSNNFENDLLIAFLFVLTISFFNQIGDLIISFLKRKANVKDTGKIIPGHGGILDRIDGMLLAIPVGIYFWSIYHLN